MITSDELLHRIAEMMHDKMNNKERGYESLFAEMYSHYDMDVEPEVSIAFLRGFEVGQNHGPNFFVGKKDDEIKPIFCSDDIQFTDEYIADHKISWNAQNNLTILFNPADNGFPRLYLYDGENLKPLDDTSIIRKRKINADLKAKIDKMIEENDMDASVIESIASYLLEIKNR